ncbi:MAG: Holliday junction branch migration protein RuvA [Planctomycetes bacterium]|nr:Holliday junction branch migration protein RuvA [Planctomycetota bacterium]
MYEHLRGSLVEKSPARAIVDVGGVGYELTIPISSYEDLPPPGGTVTVFVHLAVREDALRLYGFASREERLFFRRLLDVQGIGPAVALTVVSATRYGPFREAVLAEDLAYLTRLKGVGRKLAQRIVLDLREAMLSEAPAAPASRGEAGKLAADAVNALVTLGSSRGVAQREVETILRDAKKPLDLEEVVRLALRSAR